MTLDLAQTLRSENETKELERCSKEDPEYWEKVKDSELAQPFMLNDLDYSLLTINEWKLIGELEAEHNRRIEERARELRFYPEYSLSEQERLATLKCMTYEELRPMYRCGAIYEKCERMMKELTLEEKIDIRIFHNITIHFSEFGPRFEKLDDETVFIWTDRYHRIMKKHSYLTFEEPYSFLSEERKQEVLKAGKLDPKEYLSSEELEATRKGEGGK